MRNDMTHIVALSGGKDSTALALRLADVDPRDYLYFCTPTGDELPDMEAHWEKLERLLNAPIIRLKYPGGFKALCKNQKCLPNFRMRFCTRILKIEVAERFYREHQPCLIYVGLRADEEGRDGSYSEEFQHRYPLREWGWGISEVLIYLKSKGIEIPRRTDCARCFWQRIDEWWSLWKDYPHIFRDAANQEKEIGHTFRTPGKDSWPISLEDLGNKFDSGAMPRKAGNHKLWDFSENKCRICSL